MTIVLEDLITNGEIRISKGRWFFLNERYDKEIIKQAISDAIVKFNVPSPIRPSTLEDVRIDLLKMHKMEALKKLISSDFDNHTYSRYEFDYPLGDWFLKRSTTGNICSDHFNQSLRHDCGSNKYISPNEVWSNPKHHGTFLNSLWSLKYTQVTTSVLKTMIAMKFYTASQFRPLSAKAVYDLFDAKDIYDPSAGWGDRLAGFYASDATTYIGTDPNLKMHPNYQLQIDEYHKIITDAHGVCNKKATMIPLGSEVYKLAPESVDLVFTSPPYFDTEHYSNDPGQSYLKYSDFDKWLREFLFPTIDNAWQGLRPGGVLALNINDVSSGSDIHKICDPMNDYIASKIGASYIGQLGYTMSARPNTSAVRGGESEVVRTKTVTRWDEEANEMIVMEVPKKFIDKTLGQFVEPMWIWGKDNGGLVLQDYINKSTEEFFP